MRCPGAYVALVVSVFVVVDTDTVCIGGGGAGGGGYGGAGGGGGIVGNVVCFCLPRYLELLQMLTVLLLPS